MYLYEIGFRFLACVCVCSRMYSYNIRVFGKWPFYSFNPVFYLKINKINTFLTK